MSRSTRPRLGRPTKGACSISAHIILLGAALPIIINYNTPKDVSGIPSESEKLNRLKSALPAAKNRTWTLQC